MEAEAIGYPGWLHGPEDEDKYVEYFRETDGIVIFKAAIQKNAAKRGLGNLCLY